METDSEPTELDRILEDRQEKFEEISISDEEMVKFVIFSLNEQLYAFPGEHISEILAPGTRIFYVPGCPPVLPGVIHLRGEIASVLDLKRFLQLNSSSTANPEIEGQSLLMGKVLGDGQETIVSAIQVQQVIDVLDISTVDIDEAPDNLAEPIQIYVQGIINYREQVVTWLNLEQIFKDFLQGLKGD